MKGRWQEENLEGRGSYIIRRKRDKRLAHIEKNEERAWAAADVFACRFPGEVFTVVREWHNAIYIERHGKIEELGEVHARRKPGRIYRRGA